MTEQQQQTLERLVEIKAELETLGEEASRLMSQDFPNDYRCLEAYKGFMFGDSPNPYDSTFCSAITDIENRED